MCATLRTQRLRDNPPTAIKSVTIAHVEQRVCPQKASPSDWDYYVSPDMGLMLISVDCILRLKAGKCADEGPYNK